MGFFDGLKKAVSWINPFDNAEEERRRRQQQNRPTQNWRAPMKAPDNYSDANQNQNQNRNSDPLSLLNQPLNNGINLPFMKKTPSLSGGSNDPLVKAEDPVAKKRRELDALTAANLEAAKKQREQGENFFTRNVLNKGEIKNDAEVIARTRATNQYQEKNGYNRDSAVLDYGKETLQKANKNSDVLRKEAAQLNTFAKRADKVGEVAQWVPVAGNVLNLGLSAAENNARSRGQTAAANDIKVQRDKNEFGMSQQEMAALDPEARRKLQVVREIGYAASPLDVLGLGGLAKSAAVQTAKEGATQLLKKGSIDVATQAAVKEGVKATAKSGAKSFGAGAALTLGGQQYLTGEMDPVEAAKNGLLVAGTSQLFEGNGLKKAVDPDGIAGMRSVNPNREADVQKIANDRQIEVQKQQLVQAEQLPGDKTPAYQKQQNEIAQSEAGLPAQRQAELDNFDPLDAPAYQRQGKTLPGENPSIEQINDGLRVNADEVVADPLNAEAIGASYRETGAKNPLSLVMHTLSKNQDKGTVRALVQRLIPDADGNVLNRATNTITGTDDVSDVSTALTEAASAAKQAQTQPLGTVQSIDQAGPIDTPPVASVAPDAPLQKAPIRTERMEEISDPRPLAPPQPTSALTDIPQEVPPAALPPPSGEVSMGAQTATPELVSPASVENVNNVSSSETPVISNDANNVAQMPNNVNAGQAPAAPNLRAAYLKTMGTADDQIPTNAPNRDVLVLDELRSRADGVIANADPEDLINMYSVPADELPNMIRTPQDYALANSALKRLYEMAKTDPRAAVAASNVYDGMGYGSSKSAQYLRITQQAFSDMPTPMKISKVIQRIQALNAKKYGDDSPEADFSDPAKRSVIEARLGEIFDNDLAIREKLAAADGQLDAARDNPGSVSRADIDSAGKTKAAVEAELDINKQQFAKVYDELTPGRDGADKASDWQRSAMLSAPTGRIQDVGITGGINLPREAVNMAAEGLAGRALNAGRKAMGKSPGKYIDRGASPKDLIKAIPGALRKSRDELKGKNDVASIESVVKGNRGTPDRTDLSGSRQLGKFGRTVKAATNFATHVSEGIADAEVSRLARQEGVQKGFKGKELDNFVAATQYKPPAEAAAKAKLVHEKLNNLNENPVTNTMRSVGDSFAKHGGKTGKFIKNAIMPFPTWVGGNMWNGVTDRNVIANTLKMVAAMKRGEPQVAVRNLTRAGVGAAELYGMGYVLTEQGVLTDTDAEDKGYEGLYVHVGDRYMPVLSLGNFAPNIILGNAAHKAFNDKDGDKDNILENLAETAGSSLLTGLKGFSVSTLTGGDNYLSKGVQQLGDDAGQGLSTLGTGFIGQAIPTALRDVNAFIDNATSLNPTKEKSETKVKNEDGKTDWWNTSLSKVKDRIPVLSQSLERKKDVAAPDLLDRLVRGNRDTPGGREAKAVEKTDADTKKDRETRGVPEKEATIEKKFQDGEFDLAIEGTKYRMAEADKKGELSKTDKEKFEKDVRRMETMRDRKISFEDWKAYDKMGVSDWRKLGDPEKDDYDPELYQKLFDIDAVMTDAKASENPKDNTQPKFSAKEARKGRGGGRGGRGSGNGSSAENTELKRIQSNTVSSPDSLSKISLGDLRPEKAGSTKIPTIQQIRSSDLIKKRKISLRKGSA